MSFQQTGGILLIISGAILLVVGIVFAQMVIDGVNKQGGKIGCFDSDDNLIRNAQGPKTTDVAAIAASKTSTDPAVNGDPVPQKVSKVYQGPTVVGLTCGRTVIVAAASAASTARDAVPAFTSPTCTGENCGTIQYTLEVYGADSMNGLFTMLYYIVLIAMSLSGMGGGGFLVATSGRA